MDLATALTVLEISPSASEETALKAYKDLVRVWHPDNFATKPELLERATAKTKALNEAWEVFRAREPGPISPRPSRRRGPSVGAFLLAILILGAGGLAFLVATDGFDAELRLQKTLTGMAYLTNKGLPLALDADTQLNATFAGPGRRFTYVYQILNYTKAQVGESYFEAVRQGLKDSIRTNLGKDRNLKFFFDNAVILDYSFKDQTGADIVTLELTPTEYRGSEASPE